MLEQLLKVLNKIPISARFIVFVIYFAIWQPWLTQQWASKSAELCLARGTRKELEAGPK